MLTRYEIEDLADGVASAVYTARYVTNIVDNTRVAENITACSASA